MTSYADNQAPSELITTEEGLENVLGRPDPRVLAKVVNALDDMCLAFVARSSFVNALDDMCRAFIARSPFVIVASHDAEGRVDVSSKGDPAGFARAGPSDGHNP